MAIAAEQSKPTRTPKEITGWRYCVLIPLGWLMRLWCRTLRFTYNSPREAEIVRKQDKPTIFLFWHNRLFISAEIKHRFRPERPMAGLVSASKDGAWLAAFFKTIGIRAIRGSSSYRGAYAMKDMIAALEAGSDISITPDGPRGPKYKMSKGPALVAEKAGVPLIIGAMNPKRAWRLKSWDGFYLPVPFSQVELSGEWFANVDALTEQEQLPATEAMQAVLDRHTVDI